jgi:hypothetical protein
MSYVQKRIRCGKPRCRCRSGDRRRWHGPYWYEFWTDPDTGTTRCRYLGKHFTPPTKKAPRRSRRRRREASWSDFTSAWSAWSAGTEARDAWSRRTPPPPPPRAVVVDDSADAARLGVSVDANAADLKRAWRVAVARVHPDHQPAAVRESADVAAREVNAAYHRMLARRGWTR